MNSNILFVMIVQEECKYLPPFANTFFPCKYIAFLPSQFLHLNKIIHRDLKPDNLLLVSFSTEIDDVRAKLSDFGTSKNTVHTKVGTKDVGTPGFIAPEVTHN